MPIIIVYLIKCSLGIAALYIFYIVFFRRLTFYNINRWILTGFSMACFLFPFVNISHWFQQEQLQAVTVVDWVPVIALPLSEENTTIIAPTNVSIYGILAAIISVGMVMMLLKLLIQVWSFRKMIQKARVLHSGSTTIYEMTENIIPFSFGNAIFINPTLHSEAELEKIIQHEFIHVKEKHSVDIIWGEILQIVCWYNPFAWLLKKAIRQNLEFIADQKVLEHGFSKKEYQYLLLKVMGTQPFRIATGFSFSSLKKRIAMMNKNKSSRVHALQFLLLLPVVALLLLSFRKQIQEHFQQSGWVQTTDTIPTAPPALPEIPFSGKVKSIQSKNEVNIVTLKNGTVERYNMNNEKERKRFVETYGEMPIPPAPPAPPIPQTPIFPAPPPPPPPPPIPGNPNLPAPPPPPPVPPVPSDFPQAPPPPPLPGKVKAVGQEMTIVTDSFSYNASLKSLYFSKARIKMNSQTGVMDGSFENIDAKESMVLIDGEDFTGNRNYTAPKGSAFKVKNLDKNDAMKKYGERGKNGAIEIQVIKKNTPVSFFNPGGAFVPQNGDGC